MILVFPLRIFYLRIRTCCINGINCDIFSLSIQLFPITFTCDYLTIMNLVYFILFLSSMISRPRPYTFSKSSEKFVADITNLVQIYFYCQLFMVFDQEFGCWNSSLKKKC